MKKKTTEEFVEKSIKVHGDKYNYSLVEYKNIDTKVKIICPIHGVFEQTPQHHLNGCNCKLCSIDIKRTKKYPLLKSNEQVIEACSKKFKNKFDYKLFIYKGSFVKSKIICPIHGIFEQTPNTHFYSKYGCPLCARVENNKKIKKKKLTKKDFVARSNMINNNFYTYKKFIYISYHVKGIITCPIHGDFLQSPAKHLNFRGCPKCSHNGHINKKSCQLYILYDKKHNLYKIGITKNYNKRLLDLNEILKVNLDVIYIKEEYGNYENVIHTLYSEYRKNHPIKHGGYTEWFNFDDINITEIIETIDNIYKL